MSENHDASLEKELEMLLELANAVAALDPRSSTRLLQAKDLDRQLSGASRQVRENREVALAAVSANGQLLRHFSTDLRGDVGVVMAAVRADWRSLLYASTDLRGSKECALDFVSCDGGALKFLSQELRASREVVLEAVSRQGTALQFAGTEPREDRCVVLEAVKQHGAAFQFASKELRADKDFVSEATSARGEALQYAAEQLQADKSVVLGAVTNNGRALVWASVELREDREVVLEALLTDPLALEHASRDLQVDKDLVMLAARCLQGTCGVPEYYSKVPLRFQRKVPWQTFLEAWRSPIAVQGEDMPILMIEMKRNVESGEQEDQVYHCEVSLMSGCSFVVRLSEISGEGRSGPILNDLAKELLQQLPVHTQAKAVGRVFMIFQVGKHEDHSAILTATPWDWDRPLSDFVFQS